MIVPPRQINSWKIKRRQGDITAIHREAKISRKAITNAFNGSASEKTINAIKEYFNKPIKRNYA